MIAVADLDGAADELERRYGLASLEGGRHPGWGTANRIVPLGETYLELVAVVNEAEAAGSAFGRWVARARPAPLRPVGWAVRTDRLDVVAGRLRLTIVDGSRVTPAGEVLRWRLAGAEQAQAEPSLPFFIEWGREVPFPGAAARASLELAKLRLQGDAARLATWLGDHDLPVSISPGAPRLAEIVLAGDWGEIVLAAATARRSG